MIILIIILVLISLYGIKFSSFHKDYISLNGTNAIKGIFAILIVYSHMRQYFNLTDTFANNSYIAILKYIGQMMVTMYLFYSGYGLMESQRTKLNYRKNFPKNRLLKILIHFDIAVVLYIILQFILGKHFSILEYMGSLIGWTSLGNSNWFIFVILSLYVAFYISLCFNHSIFKEKHKENNILFAVIILCVILWGFLYFAKGQSWWFNNIMAFPLGICFSIYRSKAEEWLIKRRGYFYAAIILSTSLIAWRCFIGIDKIGICTSLFALWVVLISMRVKFDNKALQWLGTLAFPIYLLQRLPMIALTHMGINQHVWIFVLITIPLVLLISLIYNLFLKKWTNIYSGSPRLS